MATNVKDAGSVVAFLLYLAALPKGCLEEISNK